MDNKTIDDLNYLVNYINDAQYSTPIFERTIAVISSALPDKLCYIICHCPRFSDILKERPDLRQKALKTLQSLPASQLLEYYKYPAFRRFDEQKITSAVIRKGLKDKFVDNNYLATLVCENKHSIGKFLYDALINNVDAQTKMLLGLNQYTLCGEFPTINMYNKLTNTAYLSKDFALANKIAEMLIEQRKNIEDIIEVSPQNASSALQTLNSASDYLCLSMKNCVTAKDCKSIYDLSQKLKELDVNPEILYNQLLICPVEDCTDQYKDVLIKLSCQSDISADTYSLLEDKFCKYITDPCKYLPMFENPNADYHKLMEVYHNLTDFKNVDNYFDVSLKIANITNASKNLQSQIFATCPKEKYILEYIKTCTPEQLNYLFSLRSHNPKLKKVMDKLKYTPQNVASDPIQTNLFD